MLTGAYTQTVSDAPSPTSQTFAGPLVAFVPSIVALLDTPRTENSLAYTFALSAAFPVPRTAQSVPVSYANRLTYAGHYAINEITSAILGAGFSFSPLNAFDPSADPSAAPIQSVPSDASYLLTANASEGILRQLTERTSFAQAATFAYGDPIDPAAVLPRTYTRSEQLHRHPQLREGHLRGHAGEPGEHLHRLPDRRERAHHPGRRGVREHPDGELHAPLHGVALDGAHRGHRPDAQPRRRHVRWRCSRRGRRR